MDMRNKIAGSPVLFWLKCKKKQNKKSAKQNCVTDSDNKEVEKSDKKR